MKITNNILKDISTDIKTKVWRQILNDYTNEVLVWHTVIECLLLRIHALNLVTVYFVVNQICDKYESFE